VFLDKTIFKPLDMTDTAFSVPPEKIGRFAANYSRTNGLTVIDAPANRNTQSTSPFSPAAADWSAPPETTCGFFR
jgi:Beta-lactamase.